MSTASPPFDPLGAVRDLLARGDLAGAAGVCRAALARNPDDARAHGLLAHVLNRAGDPAAAYESATRAVARAPTFAPALLELAAAARATGHLAEARHALEALLRLGPGAAALHFDLAGVLVALGDTDAACSALEEALRRDPRLVPAWLALAQVASTPAERLAVLERANDAVPDTVAMLEALADAQRRALARYSDWIATLRRLCALQPRDATPWLRLAAAYVEGDLHAEAYEARLEAFARDPAALPPAWRHLQLPRSLVADDADEERAFVQQWHDGLARFEALPAIAPDAARACLVAPTNFFLHYQYDEDTAPQRRYARLVRRFATTFARDVELRTRTRRARPRIGFVSGFFRHHTVGKLFADVIARLPAVRFERLVFNYSDASDAATARLAAAVDGYVGGEHDLEGWVARLRDADLDAIVYTDLGMHPGTLALAALRLAPVQVALWGHPVTTGLDTIDHFVSSDLLEPPDGARHYTETLHRLPGLGAWYDGPAAPSVDAREGRDTIECLVPASVFKLRPAFDDLLARVAAAVPSLRYTLLPHVRAHVCEAVAQRLHRRLAEHGVDPARARVEPMRPIADFFALAARSDFALDTIGWSGGMTAIDLLGTGLPTVALAGPTMRSRQTAALLAHGGAEALVARDADDYVAKAVALAGDAEARRLHGTHLREATQSLYRDDRVVDAFANLLDSFLSRDPA